MLSSKKSVSFVHRNFVRELVAIIVFVYEPVVQQETGIALLSVRIIDLVTSSDVFACFNDEAAPIVVVSPAGLAGPSVIEHIGVRDKSISLVTLDLDAKNAAGNHHAHFRVLFDGEDLVVGDFLADQIVVRLYILNFVGDLHLERTTIQPFTLFL